MANLYPEVTNEVFTDNGLRLTFKSFYHAPIKGDQINPPQSASLETTLILLHLDNDQLANVTELLEEVAVEWIFKQEEKILENYGG